MESSSTTPCGQKLLNISKLMERVNTPTFSVPKVKTAKRIVSLRGVPLKLAVEITVGNGAAMKLLAGSK